MTIKQISVFLENKSGRLTEVLEALGKEKINITALSIADTTEYGILRVIVSDPQKALLLLKKEGFTINVTEVISIRTPSEAGSFARTLRIFSDEGISVEYMYAFSMEGKSMLVMKTEDTSRALSAIQKHKMDLLQAGDLYEF